MPEMKTLVVSADIAPAEVKALPAEFGLRPCKLADFDALAALFFAAYPPGVACATLDAAVVDMRATFSGEYGELLLHASPVITRGESLVGAVLTVRRAPWSDTPDCPFVIEVFTAPDQRRQGIASAALHTALNALRADGEQRLALRVATSNREALALYTKLGFREWRGTCEEHH